MKLKKFIGNHSHWTLNKQLVRRLGLTETLVLQHIIDLTESAFKRDEIFQPITEMSIELGVSEYSVKQAVGKLKSLDLINVERKSVGYKNFYSVNSYKVLEIINNSDDSPVSSNQPTSELSPLDDTDSTLSDDLIDSLVNTKSTLSELKTNSQRVENYGTITNNTTNNTDPIIDTKNTFTDEYRLKHSRILEGLIQTEDKGLFERSYESLSEITFDKIAEDNNWDTDVYNKWVDRIETSRIILLNYTK